MGNNQDQHKHALLRSKIETIKKIFKCIAASHDQLASWRAVLQQALWHWLVAARRFAFDLTT